MFGNDQGPRADNFLEQITARLCRQARIGAEARAPIGLAALQRMMQDVADKQDFAGAAEQARAYLALAPNASNANDVREKLRQMEQMSGTAQKQ